MKYRTKKEACEAAKKELCSLIDDDSNHITFIRAADGNIRIVTPILYGSDCLAKFEVEPLPEIAQDAKVMVRDDNRDTWKPRYATGEFNEDGCIMCYTGGATSFSSTIGDELAWKQYRLAGDETAEK